jgi:signal transduction histidine kinase
MRREAPAARPAADPGRFGRSALIAVVGAGVLATVAMNDASPLAAENLGIVALGGLFLLVLVRVGDRLEAMVPASRVLYFAGELGVVVGIFALQARLGSFGMAWILLMPLLVQGMFVWSWRGMSALTAAVLLLPFFHVLRLAGGAAALEVLVGVGAGVVFVLLFSAATRRERQARARSDRLGEELAVANRRLAELAVQAEELAAERERTRLAREIHDSVGHSLTVAHVQIASSRVHLGPAAAAAQGALDKAGDAVRQGLAELRRSLAGLRSDALAGRPLLEALELLCREASAAGIPTELEVRGEPRSLSRETALTLFRAAQEALTNVQRHSGAARAEVVVDYRPAEVALRVRDDGRGITASEGGGFGLLGVRERVGLHGGVFAAGPGREAGFELSVEIPG